VSVEFSWSYPHRSLLGVVFFRGVASILLRFFRFKKTHLTRFFSSNEPGTPALGAFFFGLRLSNTPRLSLNLSTVGPLTLRSSFSQPSSEIHRSSSEKLLTPNRPRFFFFPRFSLFFFLPRRKWRRSLELKPCSDPPLDCFALHSKSFFTAHLGVQGPAGFIHREKMSFPCSVLLQSHIVFPGAHFTRACSSHIRRFFHSSLI